MKSIAKQDKAWLLATAKAVANRLREQSNGTGLKIRTPSRAIHMDTDGWRACIGALGKDDVQLQIWFDKFTGYAERKLYACFVSSELKPITAMTKRVSRKLWPTRVVDPTGTTKKKHLVLTKRLGRGEFNAPILEKYPSGTTYYGIFDRTLPTSERLHSHFIIRAVSFFEDVARAMPHVAVADAQRDVYPRCENRKRVTSHIQRERSGLLASECKIRDKYKCRVCGFDFEKTYGKHGFEFAEAHHRVPLNHLRENIKTSLNDLATVCANCHRMLHRMSGEHGDLTKLRAIVRKHRKKRK